MPFKIFFKQIQSILTIDSFICLTHTGPSHECKLMNLLLDIFPEFDFSKSYSPTAGNGGLVSKTTISDIKLNKPVNDCKVVGCKINNNNLIISPNR